MHNIIYDEDDGGLTQENDALKHTQFCMLSPSVSAWGSIPLRRTSDVQNPRNKRKAAALLAAPDSPATKHQRLQYEAAHAQVAGSNHETALLLAEKHEAKIVEYTRAINKLLAEESGDHFESLLLHQRIQHHLAQAKQARLDAANFERLQKVHERQLALAKIDWNNTNRSM